MEVTRLLVECYFDIVRKNLQDTVPKAIMHFLVLFVQRGLQQRLIRTLYRPVSSQALLDLMPHLDKQQGSPGRSFCRVRLGSSKRLQADHFCTYTWSEQGVIKRETFARLTAAVARFQTAGRTYLGRS